MKRIATLMAFGALTLAFGCDNRDGDTDGGIHLMDDDGGTGGHDAGMMTMHDSGTSPGPDAGPRDCEMDLDPFPTELSPRCSADTKACIAACTDGDCVNACVAADTTPAADVGGGVMIDCGGCLGYTQNFCIQENGGADLLHALDCCIEDNGCTTQSCAQTMCASEFGAVYSTADPAAGACLSAAPTTGAYAVCFPAE